MNAENAQTGENRRDGFAPGHPAFQDRNEGADGFARGSLLLFAAGFSCEVTDYGRVRTRRRRPLSYHRFSVRVILDCVATDRVMVMGYHFPFPAIGHVVRRDTAYHWEAAQWAW